MPTTIRLVCSRSSVDTAAVLRPRLGQHHPQNEQLLVQQAESAARAALGDDAFEAARAEGAAMPLDEAVTFAVAALARAGRER